MPNHCPLATRTSSADSAAGLDTAWVLAWRAQFAHADALQRWSGSGALLLGFIRQWTSHARAVHFRLGVARPAALDCRRGLGIARAAGLQSQQSDPGPCVVPIFDAKLANESDRNDFGRFPVCICFDGSKSITELLRSRIQKIAFHIIV